MSISIRQNHAEIPEPVVYTVALQLEETWLCEHSRPLSQRDSNASSSELACTDLAWSGSEWHCLILYRKAHRSQVPLTFS